MRKIKGYQLLLLTSILIFITGLFLQNYAFDIQLHDTYYVIGNFHLSTIFSLIALIQTYIYYRNEKKGRKISYNLILIHVLLYVIGWALVTYAMKVSNEFISSYPESQYPEMKKHISKINNLNLAGYLIYFAGILIFFVNLIWVLSSKKVK